MKKKQYISPLSEVTRIDVMLMKKTGAESVLPGPGGAPVFIP